MLIGAVLEQKLGRHFRASLSNFYYNIKDLINQEFDPDDELLVFKNLDNVKAHGLETQLYSERKTLTGHHTDDFFLTNITLLSMNIREGMEFSASVYNIFDKK